MEGGYWCLVAGGLVPGSWGGGGLCLISLRGGGLLVPGSWGGGGVVPGTSSWRGVIGSWFLVAGDLCLIPLRGGELLVEYLYI